MQNIFPVSLNEGTEIYHGTVTLPQPGPVYAYHAWENVVESVDWQASGDGCAVELELEPYQSYILVMDEADDSLLRSPLQDVVKHGREVTFAESWSRATCDNHPKDQASMGWLSSYLGSEPRLKPRYASHSLSSNSSSSASVIPTGEGKRIA